MIDLILGCHNLARLHDMQVTYHKRAAASGRFPSFRGADNDEEDAVSTLVEEAIGPQIPAGFNRIVKVMWAHHCLQDRQHGACRAMVVQPAYAAIDLTDSCYN